MKSTKLMHSTLFAICLAALSCGCERQGISHSRVLEELQQSKLAETPNDANRDEAVPAEIRQFCGDCHALPLTGSFEREAWYDEIEKGYEFYARSGRTDLHPPPLVQVLDYYRRHAPAELEFPPPLAVDEPWRSRFRQEPFSWRNQGLSAAVSSLQWAKFEPENIHGLIATDMRDGSVRLIEFDEKGPRQRLLAQAQNPARVSVCDLNEDGCSDLLLADLGSFRPYDHSFGRVVYFERTAETFEFQSQVLLEQIGRVADVSVADFSGDEQLDVVAAEFGHRTTGGIWLLTNESPAGELRFRTEQVDIRPGVIRVPANDWNHDGRVDFAGLFSQEFECVDLFTNTSANFQRRRIATGNDLTFGSVALELADLDHDGDQDMLYANGDSFDNNFANRDHGLQWLENDGELGFRKHQIAFLPGIYKALPGDFDQDGDDDIIAVVNLPSRVYPMSLSDSIPAAIVLYEQTTSMHFVAHVLDRGPARYPCVEVADFNADGKIDFAVGTMLFDTDASGSPAAQLPRIVFWMQL